MKKRKDLPKINYFYRKLFNRKKRAGYNAEITKIWIINKKSMKRENSIQTI